MSEDTKKCPFCAETIKAEAIVCRYCGRELAPESPILINENGAAQVTQKPKKNGVVILLLLIVAAFVIWSLIPGGSSSGSRTSSRTPTPSVRTVRYEITGTDVSAVSLTWRNDSGGTEQGDYQLPFKKSYRMKPGDFTYISAQIIRPTSNAGTIECRIFIDGKETYYAKAQGFPSIASCSGSAD